MHQHPYRYELSGRDRGDRQRAVIAGYILGLLLCLALWAVVALVLLQLAG